nr:MAG: major capsid protein [Microvirus sp.]
MKSQPSTMSHNFSQVPHANVRRSSFDRSRSYKTTFNSGYLIPWLVDEILPGDTVKMSPTFLARLATPIKPFMDNLWLDWMVFFVPNRLVWDNWQRQMGEQRNPGDSVDFLTPQMVAPATTGYAFQSLQDYMGLRPGVPGYSHSSLPLRAHNLCFNEWFRDENLQNSITVDVGNGPDLPANYVLRRRGKRHDYFTSALPSPQKGPAVTIPLGSFAPVSYSNALSNDATLLRVATTGALNPTNGPLYAQGVDGNLYNQGTGTELQVDNSANLQVDLSSATAATISALRQAAAVQQLYETDARGGTRYVELLKAHFGVTSPDARLQRPEYLGGGSARVNVNPVPQTAPTDSETPQGNLAGFGAVSATGSVVKSFVEHGILIAFCSVRADLNYQQGLNRMWSRNTKLDYFWPTMQNIGEQAVLNKEIFVQGTSADEDVFGYQERYAEYRYAPNLITGKFRSDDPQSLDVWHLAQDFGSLPALNSNFIEENPPVERVVAVVDEPQFLMDVWTEFTHVRPMPMYSVPGLTRF